MTHLFLALLVAAAPLPRKQKSLKRTPAARPEDDTRLKGDDKAFAKAAVGFIGPADLSELEEDEDVRIEFKLSGYALGPLQPGGPVPHAHLIIDNEPALEIDDAAAPYLLKGLARGPHLLRVVLCRPWHEVVKAPHALGLTRFWVGPKLEGKAGHAAEFVAWPDVKKPFVTYVLPVGAPTADLTLTQLQRAEAVSDPAIATPGEAAAEAPPQKRAEHPVLDFYLSNARLNRRGDKLKVVLDRRELPLVTEWKPQHLRRARPGPHKLTVDLMNRKGLKVKNAVNRTDRAFTAGN
ncbi:MAG TPA: hypothetical protein VH083_15800 [Myxococcales bacterium]|nr:hypothetical protein [Myxococcales bacterium]